MRIGSLAGLWFDSSNVHSIKVTIVRHSFKKKVLVSCNVRIKLSAVSFNMKIEILVVLLVWPWHRLREFG